MCLISYFQFLSVNRFVFIHSIPARALESNSLLITFLMPTDQPVRKIIISESYNKALGTGVSLHGGSVGQTGVGSSTRDFEI